MFIQVQGTPNPASNMFVPGRPVLDVSLSKLAGCLMPALLPPRNPLLRCLATWLLWFMHRSTYLQDSASHCCLLLSPSDLRREAELFALVSQ